MDTLSLVIVVISFFVESGARCWQPESVRAG